MKGRDIFIKLITFIKKTIDLKLLDIKNNKIVLVTCLDNDTYLIIEAMNT